MTRRGNRGNKVLVRFDRWLVGAGGTLSVTVTQSVGTTGQHQQVGSETGSRKQQKISVCLFFLLAVFAHPSITPARCLFTLFPSFTFTYTLQLSFLHLPVSSAPPPLSSPPSLSFSFSLRRCSVWASLLFLSLSLSLSLSLLDLLLFLSDVRLMANAGRWQMDVTSRWFCLSSLITQIQSAMKLELCLVKATQSGDKFIQHQRHRFWYRKCVGICEEKGLSINGGLRVEVGSDIVLMSVGCCLVAWQEAELLIWQLGWSRINNRPRHCDSGVAWHYMLSAFLLQMQYYANKSG